MVTRPDDIERDIRVIEAPEFEPDPTAPLTGSPMSQPVAGAALSPEQRVAAAGAVPDYQIPTALGPSAALTPAVESDPADVFARHGIEPGATARALSQPPPAVPSPPEPAEEEGGFWSDVGRGLGVGANVLGAGVVGLGNILTRGALDRLGERYLDIPLSEQLAGNIEGYRSGYSPELQRQRQAIEEAEGVLGTAGAVLSRPRALTSYITESLPSMVPGLGVAGVAGRAGRAASLARGASQEVAQRTARRAAMAGGVTVETALGGGFAANEAQQAVRDMDEAVLQQSPNYQAYLQQGLTPEQAREELGLDAGQQAAAVAAPLSGIFGILGARLDANIMTGNLTRMGVAKALGGSFLLEAGQEFGQEGSEQFAVNLGTRLADPTQELLEGVPEAATLGAITGGAVGGGLATAGTASEALAARAQRFREQQQAQQQAPSEGAAEFQPGLAPQGGVATDPAAALAMPEVAFEQAELPGGDFASDLERARYDEIMAQGGPQTQSEQDFITYMDLAAARGPEAALAMPGIDVSPEERRALRAEGLERRMTQQELQRYQDIQAAGGPRTTEERYFVDRMEAPGRQYGLDLQAREATVERRVSPERLQVARQAAEQLGLPMIGRDAEDQARLDAVAERAGALEQRLGVLEEIRNEANRRLGQPAPPPSPLRQALLGLNIRQPEDIVLPGELPAATPLEIPTALGPGRTPEQQRAAEQELFLASVAEVAPPGRDGIELMRYARIVTQGSQLPMDRAFAADFERRVLTGDVPISPDLLAEIRGEGDVQLRQQQQEEPVRQPAGAAEESGGRDTGLGILGPEAGVQPEERLAQDEVLRRALGGRPTEQQYEQTALGELPIEQEAPAVEPGTEPPGGQQDIAPAAQGEDAQAPGGGRGPEYGEGGTVGPEGGVSGEEVQQVLTEGQVPRETPGVRAALEQLPSHALDQIRNLPAEGEFEPASVKERRELLTQLEAEVQDNPAGAVELVEQRLREAVSDDLTGFERGNDLRDATIARLQAEAPPQMGPVGFYVAADVHNLPGLNKYTETTANELIRQFSQIFRREVEAVAPGATFHRQGGQMQAIVPADTDPQALTDATLTAESVARAAAAEAGFEDIANPKGGRAGTGLSMAFLPIDPDQSPVEIASFLDDELRKYSQQDPHNMGEREQFRFPWLRAALNQAPPNQKGVMAAQVQSLEGGYVGSGASGRFESAGGARRREVLADVERQIEANPETALAVAMQELDRLNADPLTGWTNGPAVRDANAAAASQFVTQTGQPGSYVAIDFGNLKGLTDEMVRRVDGDQVAGRAEADDIFREVMVDVVQPRLQEAAGGASVTLGRHGGDEFHAIVVGDHDVEALQTALAEVDAATMRLAAERGVDQVPHTKQNRSPGIRVLGGVMPIDPGTPVEQTIQDAEVLLEAAKEVPRVDVGETQEAGPRPVREQPREAPPGAEQDVARAPQEQRPEIGEVVEREPAPTEPGPAEVLAGEAGAEPQAERPSTAVPGEAGSYEAAFQQAVDVESAEGIRQRIPDLDDRIDRIEALRDETLQLSRMYNRAEQNLPPEIAETELANLDVQLNDALGELVQVEQALVAELGAGPPVAKPPAGPEPGQAPTEAAAEPEQPPAAEDEFERIIEEAIAAQPVPIGGEDLEPSGVPWTPGGIVKALRQEGMSEQDFRDARATAQILYDGYPELNASEGDLNTFQFVARTVRAAIRESRPDADALEAAEAARQVAIGAETLRRDATASVPRDAETARRDLARFGRLIDEIAGVMNWNLAPPRGAEIDTTPPVPVKDTADLKGNQQNYALATQIQAHLETDATMTWRQFFKMADEVYGGTQGEGAYTPKQAYDAMELGFNQWVLSDRPNWAELTPEQIIARMEAKQGQLPTQTQKSEDMVKFQQFSSPHTHSYVAAWVANIDTGDVVLEPSAGTGNLASHAMNQRKPAAVYVNEVEPTRRALLERLPVSAVFGEDAQHIQNMPALEAVQPSVVVMNPPFSQNYKTGKKDTTVGIKHVQAALEKLNPGGRLVAILGKNNLSQENNKNRRLWNEINEQFNVRAVIRIDGAQYRKFGTTFDNAIVVIDKTGATPADATVTGKVDTVAELLPLLEEIRNERQGPRADPGQQEPLEPVGPPGPAGGGGGAGGGGAVRGPAGGVGAQPGPGLPPAGQPPSVGPSASGGATGIGAGPTERGSGTDGGVTGVNDGIVGPRRNPTAPVRTEPAEPGGRVGAGAGAGGEPEIAADGGRPGFPERVTSQAVTEQEPAPPAETVEEQAADVSKPPPPAEEEGPGEFTTATFTRSRATNKIEGGRPHPTQLAETSAMASVKLPPLDYEPNLPQELIDSGNVSADQLDAVAYSGQAHEQVLPDGRRRGFFLGDGTGVGKGTSISAIIHDNWNQGRRKAVWVTEKPALWIDAQRDMDWSGPGKDKLFKPPDGKLPIERDEGVMFTTYGQLKAASKPVKDNKGKEIKPSIPRTKQLIDWLGEDFDGVIVFDESHNMKNSLTIKGSRGNRPPTATAQAAADLKAAMPNARVIYASATGATEVHNLGYADRLGLWGEGTPFANREEFISQVEAGGVAAMEVVAKDMKAQGLYLARQLAFEAPGQGQSVEYDTLRHDLSAEQRDMYNQVARGWQTILQNMEEMLQATGAGKNGRAGGNAVGQFWTTQQRFFNQFLISLGAPSLIADIEQTLANGQSAVLQLVNTNEAVVNRRTAQAAENDVPVEEADLTPKDIITEFLMKSFPVQLYEPVTDADGNTRMLPVVDSEGRPVNDVNAVARRDELVTQMIDLPIPDGILEQLVDHFQPEGIAEVTGRKKRFYRDRDGKRIEENRTDKTNEADTQAFQDGKKRVLVFSNSGGTGKSYHADLREQNQQRRVHYLVQPGWEADKAMQGLGRTHRTNQAFAPIYKLVTTNVKAQQRFITSIARRLDQLGALTRGSREAASGGLFSADANLENEYGNRALDTFIEDLYKDNLKHIGSQQEIADALGYRLYEPDGRRRDLGTSVPQFLNRLLVQELGRMDLIFDDFYGRLSKQVEFARQEGTYDVGMETIQAKQVRKLNEQELQRHPSGATTNYVQLELTDDVQFFRFSDFTATDLTDHRFVQNRKSGRVYALKPAPDLVSKLTGTMEPRYRRQGVNAYDYIKQSQITHDKFRVLETAEAAEAWAKDIEKVPKQRTETKHLITGALLPVWDRLPTGTNRIYRARTDDGEVVLGRDVPSKDINTVLKRFGVTPDKPDLTAQEYINRVMENGATLNLANGWQIERRRVGGENRLEIRGWKPADREVLKSQGAMTQIDSASNLRVFIPMDGKEAAVFERITASKPVVEVIEKGAEPALSRLGEPEPVEQSLSNPDQLVTALGLSAKATEALLGGDKPLVNVVQSVNDLPEALPADTRGAYIDNRVYLVANNVRPAEVHGLLLHELGVHYGLRQLLGGALYGQVVKQVNDQVQAGSGRFVHARNRALETLNPDLPESQRSAALAEETIAYLVEEHPRLPIVRRIIAAVRNFLRRMGWPLQTVTEADLIGMASAAVRAATRNELNLAAQAEGAITTSEQEPGYGVDGNTHPTMLSRGGPRMPEAVDRAMLAVPRRGWREMVSDFTADRRPAWLGFLTRQQVVEVGADVLPEVESWQKAAQAMDSQGRLLQTDAFEVAELWQDLIGKNQRFGIGKANEWARKMAELMFDATLAKADPDKPRPDPKDDPDRAKAWDELQPRFEALPDDAKEVYRKVRDKYKQHYDATYNALKKRLERAEMGEQPRKAALEQLRIAFESNRIEPYFPLKRFGPHWLYAVKDGEEPHYMMFESTRELKRTERALRMEGWAIKTGKSMKNLRSVDATTPQFVKSVFDAIDETSTGEEAEALKDDIYQLYLKTLPELSVRKNALHRQGVAGFSEDALRGFANHMYHSSRQIARLNHSDILRQRLADMRKAGNELESLEDRAKAADVVVELDQRLDWMMNPDNAPITSVLTSIGFAWFLGVTPVAAVVNLSQQAVVSFPMMAAYFKNTTGVMGELAKANSQYVAAAGRRKWQQAEATVGGKTRREIRLVDVPAEYTKDYDGDVGKMIKELTGDGTLTLTNVSSLAGIQDQENLTAHGKARQTFNGAIQTVAYLFQGAEQMNREATAVAAYKLARRKFSSLPRDEAHEEALEIARRMVNGSHFDYSNANRARFMQGNTAKVLFLFKQYSQNMAYLMWRQFYQAAISQKATQEERIEAAKLLSGMLGMTTVFAGVTGLPLMGMAFMISNALQAAFGDEDEPYDAEHAFKLFLRDQLGQTWGPVADSGPLNAITGYDFASRTSLKELFFRAPDRELETRDVGGYWLEQFAGPLAGIGLNIFRGVDLIQDGHMQRGIETMAPKALKDISKVYRYGTEGALSLRGDPLMPEFNNWQLAGQALGFTPSELAERYEDNNKIMALQQQIRMRRRALINAFALAHKHRNAADKRDVIEAITRFNRKFPEVAITPRTLRRSLKARQRTSERAHQGIILDKKLRRRLLAESLRSS